jgi:hypothetical protein
VVWHKSSVVKGHIASVKVHRPPGRRLQLLCRPANHIPPLTVRAAMPPPGRSSR